MEYKTYLIFYAVGRNYTDMRTKVCVTQAHYNELLHDYRDNMSCDDSSLSYLHGMFIEIANGLSTSTTLYEKKKIFPPIRELNPKKECLV